MNLRGLRKAQGLLQKEMSTQLGINLRQYERYESGDSLVPTGRLVTLARVLKVDVDTLFAVLKESPTAKVRRKKKRAKIKPAKAPITVIKKTNSTNDTDFINYKPSPEAQKFHDIAAMLRVLIWGIKSGKTVAGAQETVKYARNNANKLVWVVAPTYNNVEACEFELDSLLYAVPGLVIKKNQVKRRYTLSNGTIIQIKSAKHSDNLRGPNVDFMWIDEGDFIDNASWYILKGRTAARNSPIVVTTTPNPARRAWIWDELRSGGMAVDAPYGIGFSKTKGKRDNKRWWAIYPTWHFPWVSEEFIADVKASMPSITFNTEYGARFSDSDSNVFRYITEALGRYPLEKKKDVKYVIGLDLAKHQDFTAVTVMDGSGHVIWIDRWTGVDWKIQKARFVTLAEDWRAIIVLDVSNVGSVIEEDLRAEGVRIHPVDMNSGQVKTDLIQCLQVAFEKKNIYIPDIKSGWAPPVTKFLIEELGQYSTKLTGGGRLSYSAPKGENDDLVISLALANWGKVRGLAGGGLVAADVNSVKEKWDRESKLGRQRRPEIFKKIFTRRRSSAGFDQSGGSLWR